MPVAASVVLIIDQFILNYDKQMSYYISYVQKDKLRLWHQCTGLQTFDWDVWILSDKEDWDKKQVPEM